MAHFREVIDKHHKDLEKESLTAEQTASIRGAIKQVKRFQALSIKPASPETN